MSAGTGLDVDVDCDDDAADVAALAAEVALLLPLVAVFAAGMVENPARFTGAAFVVAVAVVGGVAVFAVAAVAAVDKELVAALELGFAVLAALVAAAWLLLACGVTVEKLAARRGPEATGADRSREPPNAARRSWMDIGLGRPPDVSVVVEGAAEDIATGADCSCCGCCCCCCCCCCLLAVAADEAGWLCTGVGDGVEAVAVGDVEDATPRRQATTVLKRGLDVIDAAVFAVPDVFAVVAAVSDPVALLAEEAERLLLLLALLFTAVAGLLATENVAERVLLSCWSCARCSKKATRLSADGKLSSSPDILCFVLHLHNRGEKK